VVTRVLGTSFTARRYSNREPLQVAVATGKVVVMPTSMRSSGRTQGDAVLLAGMVGDVTDSTVTVRVVDNIRAYTEWTNGRLAFHQAPVHEVLRVLGDWYGYDFRLADSALASIRVTAAFGSDRPQDALRALGDLLDVTMAVDSVHDGITIVTLRSISNSRPPERKLQLRDRSSFTPLKEVGR